MKQFFALIFSFVVLFTPVYNGVVWLNYELNKQEIAEKYCENKAVPESHCEGSCHVQKTLIKQDLPQNSEEEAPRVPSLARNLLFLQNTTVNLDATNNGVQLLSKHYPTYHFDPLEDIFHPPIS